MTTAELDQLYAAAPDPKSRALDRYRQFLSEAPGPKSGYGEDWRWKAAIKAKQAGIGAAEAIADICSAMPHATHSEIARAVERAPGHTTNDTTSWTSRPRKQTVVDTEQFWTDVLKNHPPEDAQADLWDESPSRLLNDPSGDTALTLRTLYRPDDLIFMGKQYSDGIPGVNIRTATEWIDAFSNGLPVPEQIQVNPVTGHAATLSNGKLSYRCDATVARFPYAVVEFDTLPIEHQAAFILHMLDHDWPVACAVQSGGKSLHAWIRIDAQSTDEWTHDVERRLFGFLKSVGADPKTKNESRQSRTPGAIRPDTGKRQSLLYLKGGDI